jgi:glutamate-ammonia-ligase adenylyltransferase
VPRDGSGGETGYAVLGLGKLGGQELNFGSDLDLVFVYESDGETDGPAPQGNLQFFIETSQRVMNDLGRPTPSGTLYTVDARLRPEGENAMLALSYDALDRYLATRASTWERLAYSRRRVVAGHGVFADRLVRRIDAFVAGTGLTDEQAREMAAIRERMEKEKVGDRLSIKRSSGGIVDIEFIAQLLQIKHGSAHPGVRSANTLAALVALERAGVLRQVEGEDLRSAFGLLRTVEKVLRRQDEQGRTWLPTEEVALSALARATKFGSKELLLKALRRAMERSREIFATYFGGA